MKMYARIALCCLLSAVLMLPLTACGDSDAEDSTPKKDMETATRVFARGACENGRTADRRAGEQDHQVAFGLGH
ncbi:MAG: hypothetical protein LUC50_04170 [Ruminococcus sp.]|nr:hypothetical protein [Ruminococcus sp.]